MSVKADDIFGGGDALYPAIAQNEATGEVLMLGYVNGEALRLTLQTGTAWFYSRSRRALWNKGETSGNTLLVDTVKVDCDGDALLMLCRPLGPTCHTGERSCFFREVTLA
ncbi:MAG: phosphoribosyl-AMP cyclohydrolase [Oscillospiraceae bacterium]|nr:phosphoribosyl-AMP cyclohydrolase [Oscillospiraceae bacterium]